MKQLIFFVVRFMPLIFSCCIVAITVITIIPNTTLPNALIFWDKAQHVLAFAALSLTGSLAFPNNTKIVYIGLILYGIWIEVIQKYLTTTRVGDALDLLANSAGIIIGIIIYLLVRKLIQHQIKE